MQPSRGLGRSDAEARRTLDRMADLIRAALRDPHLVALARYVVRDVDGRNQAGQVAAVRKFISLPRFRFVRDPLRFEQLTEPVVHVYNIARQGYTQGDCDDAATLGGALAAAVGVAVELHAVAFHSFATPYSHVYAVCPVWVHGKRASMDLDTTAAGVKVKPAVFRTLVKEV